MPMPIQHSLVEGDHEDEPSMCDVSKYEQGNRIGAVIKHGVKIVISDFPKPLRHFA